MATVDYLAGLPRPQFGIAPDIKAEFRSYSDQSGVIYTEETGDQKSGYVELTWIFDVLEAKFWLLWLNDNKVNASVDTFTLPIRRPFGDIEQEFKLEDGNLRNLSRNGPNSWTVTGTFWFSTIEDGLEDIDTEMALDWGIAGMRDAGILDVTVNQSWPGGDQDG